MSTKTAPVVVGVATLEELNAIERFYFPPDGRGPRQPATRFCQVDESTMQVLLKYAIAWRLHADVQEKEKP